MESLGLCAIFEFETTDGMEWNGAGGMDRSGAEGSGDERSEIKKKEMQILNLRYSTKMIQNDIE